MKKEIEKETHSEPMCSCPFCGKSEQDGFILAPREYTREWYNRRPNGPGQAFYRERAKEIERGTANPDKYRVLCKACYASIRENHGRCAIHDPRKHATKKQIGVVGVDSARLLICDPQYIGSEINRQRLDREPVSPKAASVELKFERDETGYGKGNHGAACIIETWRGDGLYPVYALLDENGGILEIKIDFVDPVLDAITNGCGEHEFVFACEECHKKATSELELRPDEAL